MLKPVPKVREGDRVTEFGGKVHKDMWGAVPVKSKGGKHYYVTFTNNITTTTTTTISPCVISGIVYCCCSGQLELWALNAHCQTMLSTTKICSGEDLDHH